MNKHHELRKIARTDLSVTTLGLGTAPLGGLYTDVEESVALAVIDEALTHGIKYFDTAPLYGNGFGKGQPVTFKACRVIGFENHIGRRVVGVFVHGVGSV